MNVSISMHSPLLSIIVPSPQPSQPKSMAVILRGIEGSGSADCCAAGVCCTAFPLSVARTGLTAAAVKTIASKNTPIRTLVVAPLIL